MTYITPTKGHYSRIDGRYLINIYIYIYIYVYIYAYIYKYIYIYT